MKYFLKLQCWLFLCICQPTLAQTALSTRLSEILNDRDFKYANTGISVMDLKGDSELADINSEKSLIPASSLKLLTTFTALDILGEDYVYETRITHSGQLDPDGTLTGNLYIEGSGDPTLGSDRIEGSRDFKDLINEITKAIRTYGITCIDGDIIADESIFNSFPICPSWQWNDLGNYYASGSWGINVNENSYSIYFNTNGPIGTSAKMHSYSPFIPSITFENEVIIDSSHTGDNAYIFGGPYDFSKRIVGTLPQDKDLFTIKGAIPDPPLFMAYSLKNKLASIGVSSAGFKTLYFSEKGKDKRSQIHIIKSPPLLEIVKYANLKSINIYCESILKTIGLHELGDGKGSQGIRIIKKRLDQLGIDTKGLNMEDGSGLSARNLITPKLLTQFIKSSAANNGLESRSALLPKAGVSGTMSNMLHGFKSQRYIWAKTGSMERVLSYSGYCKTKSGKVVAFSIIINGFHLKIKEMKPKINELLDAIYRFA